MTGNRPQSFRKDKYKNSSSASIERLIPQDDSYIETIAGNKNDLSIIGTKGGGDHQADLLDDSINFNDGQASLTQLGEEWQQNSMQKIKTVGQV